MSSKLRRTQKRKAAKKSSKTSLTIFASSLIIVIVVIVYVVARPVEERTIGIGDVAPDFRLPVVGAEGLTGQWIELSSLRGRVVVLEFMVSWCKICETMAPTLAPLKADFEPRGVDFLSVAATLGGATAESTADFIKTYGADWPHLLDADNSIFRAYGVEATPTYFIVDIDGRVVSKFQGLTTTDGFESAIEAALSG